MPGYVLAGHDRALCPVSLQIPQSRGLFARGSEVVEGSAEKEVVVVERGVVVEGFVPGSGAVGSGQVMSLDSSGQNSLILL